MVILLATNPYHDEEHIIDEDYDKFNNMYQRMLDDCGYAIFQNEKGSIVTISPKQFASVEIREYHKPK